MVISSMDPESTPGMDSSGPWWSVRQWITPPTPLHPHLPSPPHTHNVIIISFGTNKQYQTLPAVVMTTNQWEKHWRSLCHEPNQKQVNSVSCWRTGELQQRNNFISSTAVCQREPCSLKCLRHGAGLRLESSVCVRAAARV